MTSSPFAKRGFQIDLGRQIEQRSAILKLIPHYAEWGYTTLVLYLENAFRFTRHPALGQRFAWTMKDARSLVETCRRHGIEVMPVIPSLGHASYILSHPEYQHLSETREEASRDCGQLCPSIEETYRFLGELYDDWAELATSGIIHVGLDESPVFGRCPLCKLRMEREGEAGLFLGHIERLNEVVRARGRRMAIWGDMFYYYPQTIPGVPKDVIVFDWFYYPFRTRPRIELFNFRNVDSARLLRRAGLSVWACPNNNSFMGELYPDFGLRLNNIRSWVRYGMETGCEGILNTSWSPNMSSYEYAALVDAAAGPLLAGRVNMSNRALMAHGLEARYGRKAVRFAPDVLALGLVSDSGYYDRLHYSSDWRRLVRFRRDRAEARAASLAGRLRRAFTGRGLPSLETACVLREYFARKCLQIHAAGVEIARARAASRAGRPGAARDHAARARAALAALEPLLKSALAATRLLWRTYRHSEDANPMARVLRADRDALRKHRTDLSRMARNPQRLATTDTLAPRSILQVEVINIRPALQALNVEISRDGREWQKAYTLWLLEFNEKSCYPKGNTRHLHSVPLDFDMEGQVRSFQVRLSTLGYGCLAVARCRWTDGLRNRRPSRIIGTEGVAQNPHRILGGKRGVTVLGDPDPEAQFHDLARRARKHFVALEFRL